MAIILPFIRFTRFFVNVVYKLHWNLTLTYWKSFNSMSMYHSVYTPFYSLLSELIFTWCPLFKEIKQRNSTALSVYKKSANVEVFQQH